MPKTAIGIGLAALLLSAAGPGAQAMPVAPLSKTTIGTLNDVSQVSLATMLARSLEAYSLPVILPCG